MKAVSLDDFEAEVDDPIDVIAAKEAVARLEAGLSEQERAVLAAIAAGYVAPEIARQLGITPRAAEDLVTAVRQKAREILK